jgi:hypothetical protein
VCHRPIRLNMYHLGCVCAHSKYTTAKRNLLLQDLTKRKKFVVTHYSGPPRLRYYRLPTVILIHRFFLFQNSSFGVSTTQSCETIFSLDRVTLRSHSILLAQNYPSIFVLIPHVILPTKYTLLLHSPLFIGIETRFGHLPTHPQTNKQTNKRTHIISIAIIMCILTFAVLCAVHQMMIHNKSCSLDNNNTTTLEPKLLAQRTTTTTTTSTGMKRTRKTRQSSMKSSILTMEPDDDEYVDQNYYYHHHTSDHEEEEEEEKEKDDYQRATFERHDSSSSLSSSSSASSLSSSSSMYVPFHDSGSNEEWNQWRNQVSSTTILLWNC